MYLLWDSDAGYVRMTFACPRRQKMQHVWCSVGTYVSVIISILLAQQKTHVAQACTWDKPAFGTYVLTPQHARIGFNIEVVCLPIDLSFHIRATTMFFLVSSTCEHGQSAIALHNVRTKQIKITIKTMRRQRPGQGRRPRAPSLRLEACATFSAAVHRSSDSKRHRVHLGR